MKGKILLTLAVLLLSAGLASAAKPKHTLFIIGDSTAAHNTLPIVGWGDAIKVHFDTTKVNVVNKARGGRSCRTYYNEGAWAEVCELLKPGDYILMGFGHNDGAPQARGSAPGGMNDPDVEVTNFKGEKETVHTFGWYMDLFVREAKAKGATPILFSQIPWRELNDGNPRRTAFIPYFKEIAEVEKVDFIDLNSLVIDKYLVLGQEEVNTFFEKDHTHTNLKGAELNAATMADAIKSLKGCKLKRYLKK